MIPPRFLRRYSFCDGSAVPFESGRLASYDPDGFLRVRLPCPGHNGLHVTVFEARGEIAAVVARKGCPHSGLVIETGVFGTDVTFRENL